MPLDAAARSLWRLLRALTFRNLLIASVVSDIGTFLQSVGAWLMLSLGAGPLYVVTARLAEIFLAAPGNAATMSAEAPQPLAAAMMHAAAGSGSRASVLMTRS